MSLGIDLGLWLRPHRGISQEKLPVCFGFFQATHKAPQRGNALPGTFIVALATCPASLSQIPIGAFLYPPS